MNLSLQTQKADSFRFTPSPCKFTVLKAFLGYVRSSELTERPRNLLHCKAQIQLAGFDLTTEVS
jgi:hypothetical protein